MKSKTRFVLLVVAAALTGGLGAQLLSPMPIQANNVPIDDGGGGGYPGTLYQEVGGGGYLCNCAPKNCTPCS